MHDALRIPQPGVTAPVGDVAPSTNMPPARIDPATAAPTGAAGPAAIVEVRGTQRFVGAVTTVRFGANHTPQAEAKAALIDRIHALPLSNFNRQALLASVEALDQCGLLTQRDVRGRTLAEVMLDISHFQVREGVMASAGTQATAGHILIAVTDNLLHPEAIDYVGSSCTAKATEFAMATTDPAGYAASVADLITEGLSGGPDGGYVYAARAAATPRGAEPRNLASRYFQSSLMETAIVGYDAANSEIVDTRGFTFEEFQSGLQLVGGDRWQAHEGQPDLASLRLPVIVAMAWPAAQPRGLMDRATAIAVNTLMPNGHAVIVTRVENGRVHFVDPGDRRQAGITVGGSDGRTAGPDRQSEGNAAYSMPIEEFRNYARYYGVRR